jgi:hypothetical protein
LHTLCIGGSVVLSLASTTSFYTLWFQLSLLFVLGVLIQQGKCRGAQLLYCRPNRLAAMTIIKIMAKFQNKYRIESNRWVYWDYSAPARYFLTLCIKNRECILGNVVDGKMDLSEYGKIMESEIVKLPQYHKRVIFR